MLNIQLHTRNEGMQTAEEIAAELGLIARDIRVGATRGKIKDADENSVGTWSLEFDD